MKTTKTIEKYICDCCGEELPAMHLSIEANACYAADTWLNIYWSHNDRNLLKDDITELDFCNKECFKNYIDKLFLPKAKK